MSGLGEQGRQRLAFPHVGEDGLPGYPETTASMCSIWVTKEKKTQSLLRASKDMHGYNVGMALLLSLGNPDTRKKSCLLSPPLWFM